MSSRRSQATSQAPSGAGSSSQSNGGQPTVRGINIQSLSQSEKCYLVGPYLRCFEKVYVVDSDGPNAYIPCGCNGWKNPAVVPPPTPPPSTAVEVTPSHQEGNMCSACRHKLIAHGNMLTMSADELEGKVSVVLEIIEHYQQIKNNPHAPQQPHIMKIKELRERLQHSVLATGEAAERRRLGGGIGRQWLESQVQESPSITQMFRNIDELKYPSRKTDPQEEVKNRLLTHLHSSLNQLVLEDPKLFSAKHPDDTMYSENYKRWWSLCRSKAMNFRLCDVFGKTMLRYLLPQIKPIFLEKNKEKMPNEQYVTALPQVYADVEDEVMNDDSICLLPDFQTLLPKYRELQTSGTLTPEILKELCEPYRKKKAEIKESGDSSMMAGVAASALTNKGAKVLDEERSGQLKAVDVCNDGTDFNSRWLVLLKGHFGKALPKMPKEYIYRLVLDRNHRHLALIREEEDKIMAAVCYRPFYEQGFAEVAFLATSINDQERGFGRHLMNHLKEFLKPDGILDLLAYADNYAVPFFEKQGFRKGVHLPAARWQGFIKDYKDSTLMHCRVHPGINFLRIPQTIAKQRQAVEERIKMVSKRHQMTYEGLDFTDGKCPVKDPLKDIPGLEGAGWQSEASDIADATTHKRMAELLQIAKQHRSAWPFLERVNEKFVPDYYSVIRDPITLMDIEERVKSKRFYITRALFVADFKRMFDNCRRYNDPRTIYFQAADELEAFLMPQLSALL